MGHGSYDTDFDRQKLIYHPVEVAAWLASGQSVGPLYTEMELSNRCNCHCLFCGVDHQVNQTGAMMEMALARKIIGGLATLGNKALMFCGHGEPLLNPEVVEITRFAAARMSVSLTTNGTALTEAKLPLLDHLEWIRFSINGGNPENYGMVHGSSPEFFPLVLGNIGKAVQRKQHLQLSLTIGTQLVLLPENEGLVMDLARRLKDLGVDYFSVKPYSQHPLSKNRRQVDYRRLLGLEEELKSLGDENFRVIFRGAAMRKAGTGKGYGSCYGCHFLAFVSANGEIWACNVFAGDRRFLLGHGSRGEIKKIWQGPRRREVMNFIENDLALGDCRDLCRMEACNNYLWRLKNPWPHDNFI